MPLKRSARFLSALAFATVVCLVSSHAYSQPPTQPGTPVPGFRGGLRIHDPSTIVKAGDQYHLFFTGPGVPSLSSSDLIHWELGKPIFTTPPAWITDIVPTQKGFFWAPDVILHDQRYLVYYSVSDFGKQTSAIALATNRSLDPSSPDYRWIDEGIVIRSQEGSPYNAIDPAITFDNDGRMWMAFGSFWGGIYLVELDPQTGKRKSADKAAIPLANQAQIEAAAIVPHINSGSTYYYLFVNWGWCCRGTESTYNIRVGRSQSIEGPYLDDAGKDLRDGGGKLVLDSQAPEIGPGHVGVIKEGNQTYVSYHYYDSEARGRPRLAIKRLTWDDAGWPIITGDRINQPVEIAR